MFISTNESLFYEVKNDYKRFKTHMELTKRKSKTL